MGRISVPDPSTSKTSKAARSCSVCSLFNRRSRDLSALSSDDLRVVRFVVRLPFALFTLVFFLGVLLAFLLSVVAGGCAVRLLFISACVRENFISGTTGHTPRMMDGRSGPTPQINEETRYTACPVEVWLLIFAHLADEEVLKISLLSLTWRELALSSLKRCRLKGPTSHSTEAITQIFRFLQDRCKGLRYPFPLNKSATYVVLYP